MLLDACYRGEVIRGRPNPLHYGFPSRLRKARKAAELSISGLAARAGVTRDLISETEAGRSIPHVQSIKRLADALGMATSLLVYGIDVPRARARRTIGQRLTAAREKAGMSKAATARASGVARTLLIYIEQEETLPGVATAEQIADALGVSPAWLAFGEGPQVIQRRKASQKR